jgi:23S rRNA (uracil1939-C5)-methyltransferase
MKPGDIIENLEVIDIADEGKAVCKNDGVVIFIDKAVPGDIVNVKIRKKHKSFFEGSVHSIVQSSAERTTPVCDHFGTCGGCKWQHFSYNMQLRFKQKQVEDAMTRIGKLENPNILPIIGSAEQTFYRNKLDYSFADRKWLTREEMNVDEPAFEPGLGFHIPGKFDKVLDISQCYLQADPSNDIRLSVRKYCVENEMPFMNIRKREGMMRGLIIRNTTIGGLMVIAMVYQDEQGKLHGLLEHLKNNFPQITSLLYVINNKANDTIHDQEIHCYHGKAYIEEQMENLTFRISPKSFFQTNGKQALVLYQVAREFAGLKGDEVVYDLYTGTGTIANFVAHQSKKVVGIEYVKEAIDDANVNSQINNVGNTVFYAGDMKDLLTDDFMEQNGRPDVIITDPPRVGMHADVVKQLLKVACKKIVYVSCNPATQARDLEMLSVKYKVVKLQPVDMFPHTAHVENVALLELID